MTDWFRDKALSKINDKTNKNNHFKGYDKKLRSRKNSKRIKVIYTPMGNGR